MIKNLEANIVQLIYCDWEIIWDKSKTNGTLWKLLNKEKINILSWIAKINLQEGLENIISNFISEINTY